MMRAERARTAKAQRSDSKQGQQKPRCFLLSCERSEQEPRRLKGPIPNTGSRSPDVFFYHASGASKNREGSKVRFQTRAAEAPMFSFIMRAERARTAKAQRSDSKQGQQ